jgi:hypothetical protein
MKKRLLGLVVLVFASIIFADSAHAQFAYEALTVSTGVVTLTAGTYGTNVKKALITVEDAPIYYTVDGTAPVSGTTSAGGVGHLVYPDKGTSSQIVLDKYEIQNFKAIKGLDYMPSATIKVTYW